MDLSPTPSGWDYAGALSAVKARVHVAEAASGRAGSGVRVLVATKAWDADAAVAVVRAGGVLVGESRMQELDAKGAALTAAGARIHVIGQLQRNKVASAVEWAQCVQTVDSARLAERISRLCVDAGRTMEVMLQVNVSGEESKAGVEPDEALAVASMIASLPALTVTGFMTIGLNSRDEDAVREGYARLREIRDQALIRSERGTLPLAQAWELSMGMSQDLEWAVAEGATMVRVGTAIMGSPAAA